MFPYPTSPLTERVQHDNCFLIGTRYRTSDTLAYEYSEYWYFSCELVISLGVTVGDFPTSVKQRSFYVQRLPNLQVRTHAVQIVDFF